jgi:hypothetical protein
MKSDGFVIKNPFETVNGFTKTTADDAIHALNLTSELSIENLKSSLREYDFSSVSGHELAMAGSLLYESGLIGDEVAHFFTSGRRAYDETGHPTGTDVKFNAIAMFNEMLVDRLANSEGEAKGFHEITRGLIRANRVLGALSYFANSAQSELSVSVYI